MSRFLQLLLAAALCAVLPARADDGMKDGVDRNAPDFVRASVLFVTPGTQFFSRVGHTFLRLECPTYGLDYCFSYESESVENRLLSFLAGNLKMGLFAVPAEKFLAQYGPEGRGVVQYALNLPPPVKQKLWKLLDEKAAASRDLPYDYIRRGCAKAVLDVLREALAPARIVSSHAQSSYRESFYRELRHLHPWSLLLISSVGGTEGDELTDVATPRDLLDYLRHAAVDGVPLLGEGPREVLPVSARETATVVTPFLVSWLVVALAVLNLFVKKPYLDWSFLGVQCAVGLFILYLMTASRLPTSCWNWLVVPFCPLMPAVWRWRAKWAWPFLAVLLAWDLSMFASGRPRVDPALLVAVLGYVVFYLKFVLPQRKGKS